MIESIEPEFPWLANWWRRQAFAVRLVLSPLMLLAMTLLIIFLFVSLLTWLPIVAALAELIGDSAGESR